jgi:hypothetical protein
MAGEKEIDYDGVLEANRLTLKFLRYTGAMLCAKPILSGSMMASRPPCLPPPPSLKIHDLVFTS